MELKVRDLEFAYERRCVYNEKQINPIREIYSDLTRSMAVFKCTSGEMGTDNCFLIIDLEIAGANEGKLYSFPLTVKITAGEDSRSFTSDVCVRATGEDPITVTEYFKVSILLSKSDFHSVIFDFYDGEKQFDSRKIEVVDARVVN